jgi:hypothetical protein
MKPTHIYAIQDADGFVKFGVSSAHPDMRREKLQTGNAKRLDLIGFGTHPKVYALEQQIHRTLTFAGLHERGEWFKPSIVTTIVANAISTDYLEEAGSVAFDAASFYGRA